MELQEQLKHVYTYLEVYNALWDKPVRFDDMKRYLMQVCDKPESTARSYITTIRGSNHGMIIVDEAAETMELDREAVKEFEVKLEDLFLWNQFDERHDKIKKLEDELVDAKDRIIILEGQLSMQELKSEDEKSKLQRKLVKQKTELDKQNTELQYYKDKDLVLRCHDRIFSLATVDLFTDSLKDLAMESDGMFKILHKHWNPFRRIKSEYEMRRQFAYELLENKWYFTATVDGEKCKCHLVPIDEFSELYQKLRERTKQYERDHNMEVGGI